MRREAEVLKRKKRQLNIAPRVKTYLEGALETSSFETKENLKRYYEE